MTSSQVPVLTQGKDGTLKIYDTETAKEYLSRQHTDQEAKFFSLLPLLDDFKKYPLVNSTMTEYFNELLTSVDRGLKITPTILLGALSEYLLKVLVNQSGTFLEDINAISEFNSKKGKPKIDYTRTLVNKVREKVVSSRPLNESENSCFIKFHEIIEQVFASLRIERNDLIHPDLNIDLSTLSSTETLRIQVITYLPYYKTILMLSKTIADIK
jgi:hypothetical protein